MNTIRDSYLFLSISRDIISEASSKYDFKNFILKEASDYQIMNIIVHGYMTEEKYNIQKEYQLWDTFQNIIQETFKLKRVHELFYEMGPICEYNLSSSENISNFILEASDQQAYVKNVTANINKSMSSVKKDLSKGAKAASDLEADKNADGPLDKISGGMNANAAASIIAFAAKKDQQKVLEKGAISCNGRPDKVPCMKSFKAKAMQARIAKLRSGMSTCNKAKNADNCKRSLQNSISKLQKRANIRR